MIYVHVWFFVCQLWHLPTSFNFHQPQIHGIAGHRPVPFLLVSIPLRSYMVIITWFLDTSYDWSAYPSILIPLVMLICYDMPWLRPHGHQPTPVSMGVLGALQSGSTPEHAHILLHCDYPHISLAKSKLFLAKSNFCCFARLIPIFGYSYWL